MSGNPNFSTHAGAIDGLELGKPIAGGEHPTLPSSGLNVPAGSSTGSTGAGLTGSDLSRSAVASGVGAGVGAGVGPGSGESLTRTSTLPTARLVVVASQAVDWLTLHPSLFDSLVPFVLLSLQASLRAPTTPLVDLPA